MTVNTAAPPHCTRQSGTQSPPRGVGGGGERTARPFLPPCKSQQSLRVRQVRPTTNGPTACTTHGQPLTMHETCPNQGLPSVTLYCDQSTAWPLPTLTARKLSPWCSFFPSSDPAYPRPPPPPHPGRLPWLRQCSPRAPLPSLLPAPLASCCSADAGMLGAGCHHGRTYMGAHRLCLPGWVRAPHAGLRMPGSACRWHPQLTCAAPTLGTRSHAATLALARTPTSPCCGCALAPGGAWQGSSAPLLGLERKRPLGGRTPRRPTQQPCQPPPRATWHPEHPAYLLAP